MKLLIVTQKVDRTDPILGFFHGWLDQFAHQCDQVVVITQKQGVYHLPHNVKVVSLGKENKSPRFIQILRFWKLQFSLQKEYDAVFVHMTPIWVVLGALGWKLLRKKVYLWYEIKRGSWKYSLALKLVRKVFAATEQGVPGPTKKLVVTGHGIDTDLFRPDTEAREDNRIVAIGRVTPIKHYDLLLRTLSMLPPEYKLTIAGGTITDHDKEELKKLHSIMHQLNIANRVVIGWVPPGDIPVLLQRSSLSLHASQGGLDKAVLQAMACGCPIVSTSTAAQEELPEECRATDETMLTQAQKLLALSDEDRQRLAEKLRSHVEEHHSLPRCIEQLVAQM